MFNIKTDFFEKYNQTIIPSFDYFSIDVNTKSIFTKKQHRSLQTKL